MIKNMKMKTALIIVISFFSILCLSFLYVTTQSGMTRLMKTSAKEKMKTSLNSQAALVDEYVAHQEDLLKKYSISPEVVDYLKDLNNVSKKEKAQAFTEKYYAGLDNWEGLYVAEWNTHIIAHSNKKVIGMYTRKGDSLKQLQNAMTKENGLYDAGIIISPASGKLILSMYCPVFDSDGTTILGYVGGGPFMKKLENMLDKTKAKNECAKYSMINVTSKMYIFDKNKSLITKEVKDKGIADIITHISQNKNKSADVLTYKDSKNINYVLSYKYNAEHDWAVVAKANEKELYADVYKTMNELAVICVISFLLIAFLSWFFIHGYTKPLDYVTKDLLALKNLKISKDPRLQKYINTNSEVGQIATALDSLNDSFEYIVTKLEKCSDSLNSSAENMTDSSEVLMQCVGENATTTEQFAKHTDTINQTVEQVDEGIGEISAVVSDVESKIRIGNEKSSELMKKVLDMRDIASSSLDNANTKIEENHQAIQEAIVNLQSLTQIDEMAKQILSITSQTNLLSLNASIEAARAGEAGRGFSIVADEIGNLANISRDTATAIQEICEDTKQNITMVEGCFDNIIAFMENDIKTQFQDFVTATNEYNDSIAQIQEIIHEMSECSDAFVKAVTDIQSQIDQVQKNPEEFKNSTEHVLEKVEQTRKMTQNLAQIVQDNEENAISIREIINRFSK